jgi:CubicO group peptidase (beta-lactamase class C family)
MTCNGLFVSNRTLDQIYEQELKLDRMPVLPAEKVQIDKTLRTVAVGDGSFPAPVMRAVYREGLGCIVLSPDQSFADAASLPELRVPPAPGDAATLPWPEGDLVPSGPLPKGIDAKALEAAWDWAFDRTTHGHPSEVTLSLLVVHKGEIVFERYAPGVDVTTRTRTWSAAKSIAGALVGIAVSQGQLALDAPLPYPEDDPRRAVTLRHVLHMSSGLDPVDNGARCAAVGSCLSYFGGASSVAGALARGLVSRPGTRWDYENYDTILAVHALKTALGAKDYHAFPRAALLDRIGMRHTLVGADRFGDFVLSSQVYTNARDLARFGLLYLNRGKWPGPQGATVIPESWVDFSRTPAPASAAKGRDYAAQWWLVPDDRKDIPADAYAAAGNRGNYAIVVPSHDLVIVRRGLDWLPRQHSFPRWDLTREVLKAFPKRPGGAKPAARP